jgi:peptide/nickel transport system permease protein
MAEYPDEIERSTEQVGTSLVPEIVGNEGAEGDERVFVASQWQLMWWRFRKHKMALLGSVVVILLYLMALLCGFTAPYDPLVYDAHAVFMPPTRLHFADAEGRFSLRPFVYEYRMERDSETRRPYFYEITDGPEHYVRLFVRGDPYNMWGLIPTDVHLFGLGPDAGPAKLFIFGSDRMGRDMFSRIVYGARISLSVGLIGVFISLFLGVLLGGISGYFGGFVDTIIQRVIELLRAMPSVPLWMGLAAALPSDWPSLRIYFLITVILSVVGWTGMARVVRGKFLSLREEDFVLAARLVGAGEMRIILRHMVPSFLSHIIASLTLSIPGMILGETSLSFLGLGLKPPVVSWGVLLKSAQNLRSVSLAPWLLIPGVFVVVTVLSFNFMGDGLRDAADPYSR